MNRYLKVDPWCIIEEGFDPVNQRASESIFSLGNGRMGQRANFEETYSGDSLSGSYIAGLYYPDKTRVGWWKNGYPEYFAKVVNSTNWIGIDISVDNEMLDLAKWKIHHFSRILNMKEGTLSRKFVAENPDNRKIEVDCTRFLSMNKPDLGIIMYTVKIIHADGLVRLVPYLNGDVYNEDTNYNEQFWDIIAAHASPGNAYIESVTRKTGFVAGFAMNYDIYLNDNPIRIESIPYNTKNYAENSLNIGLKNGESVTIYKYVAIVSSLYCPSENVRKVAEQKAADAVQEGYKTLLHNHQSVWQNIWKHSDIKIEGDTEAQQGIRFNIFQLNQTYRGDDPRLNIGPKGFTGEKYGGSTYWDTEAFCLPFFLSTAPESVARNLLVYRYRHLAKAIENAQKLGFTNNAALFPMVTINGEECHNEWEITFEEIHRNGAIAYAIHYFINCTGNKQYLVDYGLEVLIGIARFWKQRVSFSKAKNKYVILGVTGPNEYENNVNNNWYTNTMAVWCLRFTIESIIYVKNTSPLRWDEITKKWAFVEKDEVDSWNDIIENMHFPYEDKLGIFLQQDGYLDKELLTVDDIPPEERPINQHWSWDRILRSCFIKQADVLQGIYFFEEKYDTDTIRKNFEFYEQRTVHESSLSACVHSILASRIGNDRKAYELYLRSSRLDIDDYNNEVHEGLHITSMAGAWMSIVEGFGGKRLRDGKLWLYPILPSEWKEYSFKIVIKSIDLLVTVNEKDVILKSRGGRLMVNVYGSDVELIDGHAVTIPVKNKR